MRYLMKQKLIALGDDFTIQDEQQQDRYFVDGAAFSIGDKLSFRNMDGEEVARIEQKVLSFGTQYRILRDGNAIATVKKKPFTLCRDVFEIEDAVAGELDAEGDFLDYEYQFLRNDLPIAAVSKSWFSWTDTYGIEIAEGEDDVLILACAVVIDVCSHDE